MARLLLLSARVGLVGAGRPAVHALTQHRWGRLEEVSAVMNAILVRLYLVPLAVILGFLAVTSSVVLASRVVSFTVDGVSESGGAHVAGLIASAR